MCRSQGPLDGARARPRPVIRTIQTWTDVGRDHCTSLYILPLYRKNTTDHLVIECNLFRRVHGATRKKLLNVRAVNGNEEDDTVTSLRQVHSSIEQMVSPSAMLLRRAIPSITTYMLLRGNEDSVKGCQ